MHVLSKLSVYSASPRYTKTRTRSLTVHERLVFWESVLALPHGTRREVSNPSRYPSYSEYEDEDSHHPQLGSQHENWNEEEEWYDLNHEEAFPPHDRRRNIDGWVQPPPRAEYGFPPRNHHQGYMGIVERENRGNAFEIRPGCLGILPHFYGRATEEPYTHLFEYEATCWTIGGHGFTTDEVKLVLFQFSLKDRAKQWFLFLPSESIATWAELQQQFLDEYFPPHKTMRPELLYEISSNNQGILSMWHLKDSSSCFETAHTMGYRSGSSYMPSMMYYYLRM
ncbi:hypothetical protein L1987_54824 [Smallanthus sonchifolius]|uniref:Uncharacterized protein n=1 Tax=Smallanthus sonchifolius TaxID=185202 RepID=A0ACB9E8J7_9ASTR|nr:hypothetical protein L1987_54824 [Smallanthus sonchifolius]